MAINHERNAKSLKSKLGYEFENNELIPLALPLLSPTQIMLASAILCPNIVLYRNGVFLADKFCKNTADRWFEHLGDDLRSVEITINHLDFDDFSGVPEKEEEISAELFDTIASSWETYIPLVSGRAVEVVLSNGDQNPSNISFCTSRIPATDSELR